MERKQYLTTHLLGRPSPRSERLTIIVQILLPETDNCPSFLNQLMGENDLIKYFMINLHVRMLPTLAGLNLRPPGLQSDAHPNHQGWLFNVNADLIVLGLMTYQLVSLSSARKREKR